MCKNKTYRPQMKEVVLIFIYIYYISITFLYLKKCHILYEILNSNQLHTKYFNNIILQSDILNRCFGN